ncbi:hypothetical protein METUNv1_01072 [Methyloversatilis universalis FAM5]|uniref:Uncharacterized protein n=1 Tax=Methyloversatilis universalis (strain ATCC BAA-1314 / DSM 25237 / JCM 13912 / CCUG 52030 / FAM5) TaxID=1000565 RepID=F5R9Z6_METUF|nr:hypothetical protein METUNv1_01072 [Methyloversatilis universalis FAM5]
MQDGRFKSSPFSDRGGALLPGSYTIELVGPITAVQPTARALGPDYKNFSSPLLKRGKLGTTLEYRNTLKIPGQSSSVADANARRVAEQEKAAWVKTSCADIPAIKEQLTGKKMAPPEHEKFLKDCADGKGN